MTNTAKNNIIDSTWYTKTPGVTEDASAGGIIVRNLGGQVHIALVRENKHDLYILPKGGLEPGEDPESTARREIEEEAGLTGLELLADLGVQERFNFRKTYWKKIYYFLYRLERDPGIPTDPYHDYVCDWFPLDDLPAMLWPEQRQLVEQNRDLIRGLLSKS